MAAVAADRFVDALLRAGYDFFTGVPCSLVASPIAELERRGRWFGELREDSALGVAAGAWLAGRVPAVIMQNSGLGVSLNALGSLHLLYRLPCLLIVTWRGWQGTDAPEHRVLGGVLPDLLSLVGVSFRTPTADSLLADVAWSAATLRESAVPVGLLVRPGLFDEHA